MQYRDINIKEIKSERITWFGITYFYKFLPRKIVKKLNFII